MNPSSSPASPPRKLDRGLCRTPALALCIAITKAREAMKGKKG